MQQSHRPKLMARLGTGVDTQFTSHVFMTITLPPPLFIADDLRIAFKRAWRSYVRPYWGFDEDLPGVDEVTTAGLQGNTPFVN